MPLGMKVCLGLGHIVLHGDPALPKRGTAPHFRPMSIVAKRSPISATAEHLSEVELGMKLPSLYTLSHSSANKTVLVNC